LTDSGISDFDLHLFGEGNHERIYDKLALRVNLPPLGALFLLGPQP